jgi:hypothetical protein
MIFRLVVSDTSDGTHCVQTPNLARCFVGVSVSTITSFSWFFMETDTFRRRQRLVLLGVYSHKRRARVYRVKIESFHRPRPPMCSPAFQSGKD